MMRRSRKYKHHAMQEDEKIDAILDLLEALCIKQDIPIPKWIKHKEPPYSEEEPT